MERPFSSSGSSSATLDSRPMWGGNAQHAGLVETAGRVDPRLLASLLKLRRRWSDGTTHVRFTPFELIERLAALIPRPGTNQILYHRVLGANAKWRDHIVPKPHRGGRTCEHACASSRPNHTWAELMRRGLDIDSLECPRECGGRLRFVATIEEPVVIARMVRRVGHPAEPTHVTPARAPPEQWQLGPAA